MAAAAKPRIFQTEQGTPIFGVMAEFATPADIYHAAEKVRDAGFSDWDVYSPFPVHGIDEAMGIKRTRLPLLVAVVGLSGAVLGFGFQYWVATQGYATVVQGKPFGSWQTFVPVAFEIGVLFTAFATLLGMLIFNRLPRWHHPLMCNERFLKVSDDRFVIAIEATDPKFDPQAVRTLLQKAGATSVELVEDK
ncbi:MAG: DUF3341 domain-containing protein [Planctomycetaceae bacterium]|jgi:hypothetical protein|nr:DUF3341 domain-containing protein [Phycisphaerales bacterium]MCE2653150.1 DUF3341 domain-containing protein [Planctomycetaceae bacterium]